MKLCVCAGGPTVFSHSPVITKCTVIAHTNAVPSFCHKMSPHTLVDQEFCCSVPVCLNFLSLLSHLRDRRWRYTWKLTAFHSQLSQSLLLPTCSRSSMTCQRAKARAAWSPPSRFSRLPPPLSPTILSDIITTAQQGDSVNFFSLFLVFSSLHYFITPSWQSEELCPPYDRHTLFTPPSPKPNISLPTQRSKVCLFSLHPSFSVRPSFYFPPVSCTNLWLLCFCLYCVTSWLWLQHARAHTLLIYFIFLKHLLFYAVLLKLVYSPEQISIEMCSWTCSSVLPGQRGEQSADGRPVWHPAEEWR